MVQIVLCCFFKWFNKGMGASRPGPLMACAPTDFVVANLPEARRDALQ
jgi:hypothetical protein